MTTLRTIAVFTGLLGTLSSAGGAGKQPPARADIRIPWVFEKNAGQIAGEAKAIARQGGRAVEIHSDRIRFATGRGGDFATLSFEGARKNLQVALENETGGRSTYLMGNNAAEWLTGVPHYSRARVEGLYPGIDVLYYGSPENLEFDLLLKRGADLSRIRMRWAGVGSVKTGPEGSIFASTQGGDVRLKPPRVFELQNDGERVQLEANYLLDGDNLGFRVPSRDSARTLVIDPELVYSSPIFPMYEPSGPPKMAVDREGYIYVLSEPNLVRGYPTTPGVLRATPSQDSSDLALMKLSPNGDRVIFSTFIGGSDDDLVGNLAIDPDNNPLIVGATRSRDLPIPSSGYLSSLQGGRDGFVIKLKPDGTGVLAGTHFGSRQQDDTTMFVAVAPDGDIWVAGTGQLDVPTTSPGPFDNPLLGPRLGYLARLDASLSSLKSYIRTPFYAGPGTSADSLFALGVDSTGRPLLAARVQSGLYPVTRGAIQSVKNGVDDAYIARLEGDGSSIIAATYLGGSEQDVPGAVALGRDGSIYVAGDASSNDFPVSRGAFGAGDFLSSFGGGVFVAKFNEWFTELNYSALVAGPRSVTFGALAVDSEGGAWITGSAGSSSNSGSTEAFPTTHDAFSSTHRGRDETFVARLSPDGSALSYSTLIGGTNDDRGHSIHLVADRKVLALGTSNSADFPASPGALQKIEASLLNAFVARIEGETTSCRYFLSPSSGTLKWNAGLVEIKVETDPGCAWSATTGSAPNVGTIQGVGRGAGPGVVRVQIENYNPEAVTFEVVIGGKHALFTVLGREARTNFRLKLPGVVSVGQSSPAARAVAANSIIAIYGEEMSLGGEARIVSESSLVSGRLPDRLGDFTLTRENPGAAPRFPLLAVTPDRAYAVVPEFENTGGYITATVNRDNQAGSQFYKSYRARMAYQSAAPELFYWTRGEFAYNPIAAIHKEGGTPLGDESLFPEKSTPARPGETILIYATGFGQTFPPIQPGAIPVRDHRTVGKVQVFLGDAELPAESILFAGVRPLSQPFEIDGLPLLNAGLNQLEIRIPDDIADGNHLVEVIIDGYRSPSRGFIAVRRPAE